MSLDMAMRDGAQREMERLRTLVLADADLQDTLGPIEDPAVFAASLAELARSRGTALDARDVMTWMDRAGRTPAPVVRGFAPVRGWLPTRLSAHDEGPAVDWAWFGGRRLSESFYDVSAARARAQPFNRLFRLRTPLAELAAWSRLPGLQPDGLIFHMSRCGSTLTAQMLAADPSHIVLSEAPPIDAIVRLDRLAPDTPTETRSALLQAMVGVLGQMRDGGERRYFVKLDSWHNRDLALFRRAFPSTPWVFLYRDPLEVLVSQVRQCGVQFVPAFFPPAFYGIELPDGVPTPDYYARVLAAICAPMLRDGAMEGGLLVNYCELPDALFTRILPHFGVRPTKAGREAMTQAARLDSKSAGQTFAPDSREKRSGATEAVRRACALHLDPVYRDLERLRTAQAAPDQATG